MMQLIFKKKLSKVNKKNNINKIKSVLRFGFFQWVECQLKFYVNWYVGENVIFFFMIENLSNKRWEINFKFEICEHFSVVSVAEYLIASFTIRINCRITERKINVRKIQIFLFNLIVFFLDSSIFALFFTLFARKFKNNGCFAWWTRV